jgi:hypothetical protein
VFGVSGLSTAQADQTQRFTVIDRTMVCASAFEGGVPDRLRSLSVGVGRELGEGQGQFAASIHLNTGRSSALASVHADAASEGSRPYVLVNRRSCKVIRLGLPGVREERSAPSVEFRAGCKLLDAPARIVVRLRVTMQSPARWSVYQQEYLWARGTPLEATLVVRTYPARKPLAFASFARDGSARFFAVPRCSK